MNAPMNIGSTMTRTELPQSVINIGFMINNPWQFGAGSSVVFRESPLATVYDTMTPPVILLKPGP
jgi:hypothetical protein